MVKVSLKNIGMIGEASIEINGITVLAGENNTGKSTFGRALFAMFNGFSNVYEQIEKERVSNIFDAISPYIRNSIRHLGRVRIEREMLQTFIDDNEKFLNNIDEIRQELLYILNGYNTTIDIFDGEIIDDIANQINETLNISDNQIFSRVLKNRLNDEFGNQILNVYFQREGEISVEINGKLLSVKMGNDNNIFFTNDDMLSLTTEAVYIDDPFVVDDYTVTIRIINKYFHREHLKKKMFPDKTDGNIVNEIIVDNKLKNIYNKISSVCNGDIVRPSTFDYGYRPKNSDVILPTKNISAGLKTFAILKKLLSNKTIENKGVIILDEPEVHLHPEWQLLFAEIIVLLQKEFNLHILITTHSPYFLNAIEVYSAKYEIDNKCKYYLTSVQNNIATIKDVTNYTEDIYSKLAKPLQDLENERYADD